MHESEEVLKRDLESTHQRLELAIRSADQGIWELDLRSGVQIWDERMFELFGVDRDTMTGGVEAWARRLHPEDRARVLLAQERALLGLEDYDLEYRVVHPDGAVRWLKADALVIRDDQGRPLRMIGTNRDITAGMLAQAAARDDLERLQALLRIFQHRSGSTQEFLDYALDEALQLTGSRYGYVYRYSEALEQFVLNSWSRDVMPGCAVANPQSCYDLAATGIWGEAVRQRRPIILNDFPREHPLKKGYPEGHVHLDRFMTVPVFLGEQIVAVVGLANKAGDYDDRDVAQISLLMDGVWRSESLRDARESLLASEGRLELALESARMGVWRWDIRRDQRHFDAQTCRLLGLPSEGFDGTREAFLRAVLPEDRPRVLTAMLACLEAGTPCEFDYRVQWPDGSVHCIATRGRLAVDDAGRPVALNGVVWDITGQKAAEEQIRGMNEELESQVRDRTAQLETAVGELEAFSYSVSHDLRAPLRAIDGFSRILADDYGDRLDQDGLRYLERVRQGTRRMDQLIDDLLKLSRVSRDDLTRLPLDLSAQAGRVLEGLAQRDPGRAVTAVVAPGLRATGDPRLLGIALENLIGNAWKYTCKRPDARIEIGCATQGREQVFHVRDNGAGFDMAHAGRLFSAFQRLHSSQEYEGSGIGLAIVQRIIHRHGGRIWAEAEADRGAAFYFTLPAGASR